jgi:hypothetical protein
MDDDHPDTGKHDKKVARKRRYKRFLGWCKTMLSRANA